MIVWSLYTYIMDYLIFKVNEKSGVSVNAQNAEKIEFALELTAEIKSIVEMPNKFLFRY